MLDYWHLFWDSLLVKACCYIFFCLRKRVILVILSFIYGSKFITKQSVKTTKMAFSEFITRLILFFTRCLRKHVILVVLLFI